MLGTHARIVEAGRHRMGFADLAVLVLQHEVSGAVQPAARPADDRSRVTATRDALASGLDADQTYGLVAEKRAEDPDGVRAATHARHDRVRQAPERRDALIARLGADDRLKVADHRGIGMRPDRGAKQVIRGADVRHPVADRFVHRVLQRAAPGLDLADLGAQQLHAEDVRLLASCVDGAHVHDALEPEESARGRGGDAVLARPGLAVPARARLRDHACTARRMEAIPWIRGAGSSARISAVPTSTASTRAGSIRASSTELMPDSATRTWSAWTNVCSCRTRPTSISVGRRRFRALTPTTRAPHTTARPKAGSSCASTSAVIPRRSTRATISRSGSCSRSAASGPLLPYAT